MKEWLMEIFTVFCLSRRTQYSLLLGTLAFIAIHWLGYFMLKDFELTGYFVPLNDVVKEKLLDKYDKAALGCLLSSFVVAIKCYRKDKKRFYGY